MKRKQQQEIVAASVASKDGSYSTRDMLYVVMQQYKTAEKTNVFVQDVTCAPEPMAMLCTEQQLRDLVRFGCDDFTFCICWY